MSGRTPLAGRNRIECEECGEVIDGDYDLARTVHWGQWDTETQSFEGPARQEHYCGTCWRDEFEREAAAYYEVTDSGRLWDILEAADGQLVADLGPLFVGGHPWVRVVDGDLQAMRTTVDARQEGDQNIIEFGVTDADVDRRWFAETFRADWNLPDDTHPTIALLKQADETPFRDYDALPEDQSTLEEHECAVPREGGTDE